ncbi:GGDEF domain-containing protein [Permianibacter sp. IMCC34836]|uniref:diguanylate cyclase n=1 Tax=Permianibacter fluminis TaxID=2738515 RepID=UPI0015563D1A|nr:tetratricopeptide repeat-containing diguanylate cyclase [Permianibacter fluminis]NQD37721.1 GGDEF domain-containing protein [Permianibacter fluminis]
MIGLLLLAPLVLSLSLPAWSKQAADPAGSVTGDNLAALLDQAEQAKRSDAELAVKLTSQVIDALQQHPDAELELRARFLRCDELIAGAPAKAREEVERGLQLAKQSMRDGWRAGFLSCLGNILEFEGKNTEAEQQYSDAVAIAEVAQDHHMLAHALYQRGYIRGVAGNYSGGLADLQRSHGLYEKINKPVHARTVINSIATLYNRMGDFAQARQYYERSVRLLEAENEPSDLGIALHNLGRTLENLALYDDAQKAFERALAAHLSIGYDRGVAYARRGLGSVLNARLQPEQALKELDLAMPLARSSNDNRLQAQIQLQRGIALRQLKRYREARAELDLALAAFKQIRAQHELRDTYAAMATLNAELENWRAAYEAHVSLKQIADQLATGQRDQQLALIKVQFDTRYQEQQNRALEKEKAAVEQALAQEQRANRLQVIVIVLGALVLLLLVFAIWRQWRNSRKLQAMAMTDELTGLANRRRVLATLDAMRQSHRATERQVAVLIADLDHFKLLNDSWGHLVGDKVLKRVAAAFRTVVREQDVLGRLGGEEFLLLLPSTDKTEALQVAERVRGAVAAIDLTDIDPGLKQTISLGGTSCKVGDEQIGHILARADAALYSAKEQGRNRVLWQD